MKLQRSQHILISNNIPKFNWDKDMSFLEYLNFYRHSSNESFIYDDLLEVTKIYDNWIHYMKNTHHKYHLYNRLYEFLHTVDYDTMAYRMPMIPNFIGSDKDAVDVGMYFSCNKYKADNDNKFSDDIENYILDASEVCGYTESYRVFVDTLNAICIMFRPNYTQDMTEYVKNISHNILYHVCPKDVYEYKICKTGLIPKFNNKHKRIYAPRIYFYTMKVDFTKYASDLKNGINDETLNNEYKNYNDYVVLKIDLNKNIDYTYHFY